MHKEGVIKFNLIWKKKPIPASVNISEIVIYRNKLYRLGLIGVTKQGIGFGNISIFNKDIGKIIISGSGTGDIKRANRNHFSIIDSVSTRTNTVKCSGLHAASSESITHYTIYRLSKKINCVIHIHNSELWKKLKNILPSTNKDAAYGTPEMSYEIKRLWKETDLKKKKIIVMKGHKDGIISFGENLNEAVNILNYFRKRERHK